ncbi:MAG: AraC family transcriptional regulator [bacterium]
MTESIRYFNFPLAQIDAMGACTARSYPRHSHDQYGIGVIDDGGHSSWSGRGQVEAGPGRLICCNPGEVTDGRAVGGRPRSWRILYFEPDLMRTLCADVRDGVPHEFTFGDPVFASDQTRGVFDRTFAHAMERADCHDVMPAESALLGLVARLHVHSTTRVKTGGPVGSIRRAKDRIDADPAAPVMLVDLAREAGLSRYQLLRAFSRELGITPHAYILQCRIQLARRLIRARYSLAEVAVVAGFHDQPHLTRCFVRQFGVTPRRYAARLA